MVSRTFALACVALSAALALVQSSAASASERSRSARAEFVRQNPCPATGKSRGACPGWHVDHVTPLKCRGADAPHNMQWLTVQQHKIKTAQEARLCRAPRR